MMHRAEAQPKIYVTTHDYERLSALADFYKSRRRGVLVDFLVDELERAELVPAAEVGHKVVTIAMIRRASAASLYRQKAPMYRLAGSRICARTVSRRSRQTYRYPNQAKASNRRTARSIAHRFARVIQQAVLTPPTTYRAIVAGRAA